KGAAPAVESKATPFHLRDLPIMYQDYVGHNELIEPAMAHQYDYYLLPTVPAGYWDKPIQESKADVKRGSGR
ncbi:MAG: hypothetical protein RLZZ435_883, partial [Cyanobacteriota bacterium]